MKKLGKELVFISRIIRDGSGVENVYDDYIEEMKDEIFELRFLSLSSKTYIAFNFNVFIVRLKEGRT